MPSNFAVEVKGRSSAVRFLKFGNLTLALKLYTSIDKPKSELHKGCPACLGPIKSPNVCQTEGCENHDSHLNDTLRIYVDAGHSVHIPDEELESLMLPDGSALPDKENIIIHKRLNEKEAYSMLSRSTSKYYLVPDSQNSASIYAVLLHTMLSTKQALMVKFCLTSQRQNLGVIVEDEGQLVLCVMPYAAAFRPQPIFRLPTEMSETIVHSVTQGFLDFPSSAAYADATDEYQVAFDHFLENKIKEAAIKRGDKPKTKKDDKMVALTLQRRPTPSAKAERAEGPSKRNRAKTAV